MSVVDMAILAGVVVLSVPIVVLFCQCVLALLPPKRVDGRFDSPRPRIAVLVPAHNEESVIERTLQTIVSQLQSGDRLVVVADNCEDGTAEVARRCGADVQVRRNERQRGKGYALDFGLRCLEHDRPDVVVMIDADCHVHENALIRIAQQAMMTGRPVQALYLMHRPASAGSRDQLSALAFLVKNLVRPTGLARAGLPCPLHGSGMAFTWDVIASAQLASGNIVEDMQLGLDLAVSGHAPLFCPQAKVTGQLPGEKKAAVTQRTRWEHGQLKTLFHQVPRILFEAVRQKRPQLLAIALDIAVPPLTLLAVTWTVTAALSTMAFGLGASALPLWVAAGGGVLLGVSILAAWFKFARTSMTLMSLLGAPVYLLWKLPMYLAFFTHPQKAWVRTDRGTG